MSGSTTKKKTATALTGIRNFCRKNADEKQAARYARFFTEGYDPYGIPKEIWETESKRLVNGYKDELGMAGCLDLGDILLSSGKYEEASFAILSIKYFRDQLTPAALKRIGKWLDAGIRNWAHTDILCGEIISYSLVNNIFPLEAIAPWRSSHSKWKRRAVPVSMLGLLKKEIDYKHLLEFIRPMMMDEQRVVHQGLGWFLREAWKKKPAVVESFLLEWKDSAPRLIFQYATEKMSREEKARFQRVKKKTKP